MTETATAHEQPASPPLPPLWRNRDYTLLLSGRTVAVVGSNMTSLAMMLLSFDISRNSATAAVVMAFVMVGSAIMMLPAGALVDRWDKRRTMVITSFGMALVLASVPIALLLGVESIPHLCVVGLLVGAGGTFYAPAEQASIRRIVPAGQVGQAMSANQVRQAVGSIVGPPLAGALYGLSRLAPLAGDALANLVAGTCAALTRADLAPRRTEEERAKKRSLAREMLDGLRFIFGHRVLRALALLLTLANFGLNSSFYAAILNLQRTGTAPAAIGLIDTVAGGCGLVGAVLTGPLLKRLRVGTITIVMCSACALMALALVPFHSLFAVMVIVGVLLLVNPSLNAGLSSYFMVTTPDHMQGRASGALGVFTMATMPLTSIVAGSLLQYAGVVPAMLPGIVVAFAAATLTILSASLRSIPRAADFRAE